LVGGSAIDFLTNCYALFLHVLETLPPDWRALFAAILTSLMATQWLKYYLPDSWHAKERSLGAELIGLACGATIVMAYDPTQNRILHAVIAGLAGPLMYRIAIALTARRWPEVAASLSQDEPPCGL
jgi:hypothetical protein